MKLALQKSLLIASLAVLPSAAGMAQCSNPITIPGGGTQCPAGAPEVSTTASTGIGGAALMLCGVLMIRGRRRKAEQNS